MKRLTPPAPLEEIHGIIEEEKLQPPTIILEERLGHRVTQCAWHALAKEHGANGLNARLRSVLESLAPIAYAAARNHHILCTNYEFEANTARQTLYYRPNADGGITISLPNEDRQ